MTDAASNQDEDARPADDYELDPVLVGAIVDAIEESRRDDLLYLVEPIHAADFADLLEQISGDQRRQLIELLGADFQGRVLSELEEGARDEVLEHMDPAHLAEAVKDLESDDVVYVLEDLEDAEQKKVLEALDADDRAVVEQSLTYPEDSAGRLMQRELVKAPPFWTVGQTIDFMRASEDLPDAFYDVIIVDPAMRPIGAIPLSKIMGCGRPVALGSIMTEDLRTIPVDQSQEDVAYAFNQYHLVSAPVVDEDGRLVGVITIDDAMEVLDQEADEDLKRLGGVGDEDLSDRVWAIVRRRFPWLAVNLATSILASMVIAIFDATIEQIVALAVLMPIVASMGGNAGTQTLTVSVRALATRDLTSTNAMRVVAREALVGLFNGIAFAVIIGVVGYLWYGDPMLGVVLGIAMVGNMLVAGLAGILIPIGLDKMGADPALASGAFVTTVTDVVGFLAFLGLAALLLL